MIIAKGNISSDEVHSTICVDQFGLSLT